MEGEVCPSQPILQSVEEPKAKKLSEQDFIKTIRETPWEDVHALSNCLDLLLKDYKNLTWTENVLREAIDLHPILAFSKLPQYQDAQFAESLIKEVCKKFDNYFVKNYSKVKDYPWAKTLLLAQIKKNPRLAVENYPELKQEGFDSDSIFIEGLKRNASKIFLLSPYPDIYYQSTDPVVMKIREIIDSGASKRVLCFLDPILKGEITIAEAEEFLKDDIKTLERLSEVDSHGGDYPQKHLVQATLKYLSEKHVVNINHMHAENDAERFGETADMTAKQLFILMSHCDTDQFFTSSFLGLYKRLVEKSTMENQGLDHIIEETNSSGLDNFVASCVSYNILNDFLGRLDDRSRIMIVERLITKQINKDDEKLKNASLIVDALIMVNDTQLRGIMESKLKRNTTKRQMMKQD